MMESSYRRIELHENAAEYADLIKSRRNRMLLLMMGLLVFAMSIIIVMRVFTPGAVLYSPIVALAACIVVMLPVLIWNNPRVGLNILVCCACLFMQVPPTNNRDITANVPVFWNIATIGEHYAHTTALGMLHINFGEVLMACTALFFLMRQITMRDLKIQYGAFFGWFALYLVWAVFGFVNGLSKGGDITFALWELRAQAYFALAYLLAVNLIVDRKHAMTLLWIMCFSIGLKSIIGTINFLGKIDVSADEGVLSHEDSLLLNYIFFGAILLSLAKVEPKLKWAFMAFVPTALAASLANGRRAGIAAFIVAFPVVVAMSAVLLRERRQALVKFMIAFACLAAVYLPIAWNATGAWALPARAIKSQSSPDGRDASSDYYRLAENANLRLTRDTSPWIGYGYGRHYITAYTQVGRYDPFANILPHNGILWIWMRLGHIGFILFWMFVANVLIRGPQMMKTIRDPSLQMLGIFAIAAVLMLIIYGQFDLSFANYRTMWLTGTMLGILAVLPRLIELKQEERTAAGKTFGGQSGDDTLDVREVDAADEEADDLPEWQTNTPNWKRGPGWTRGADW